MRFKRWPIVLAALGVLFAGLTSAHAHVHLCFDGQEPPASVHGAFGDHARHAHHAFQPDQDHDDLDIDLQDQALTKSFKPDLPAVAPSALCVLPLAERAQVTAIAGPRNSPRAPPRFSLPRLRAPPR